MYERLSAFAQVWGTLLIAALFVGVLIYALWPGNREKFRRAAAKPLEDGPPTAASEPNPSDASDSETRS